MSSKARGSKLVKKIGSWCITNFFLVGLISGKRAFIYQFLSISVLLEYSHYLIVLRNAKRFCLATEMKFCPANPTAPSRSHS